MADNTIALAIPGARGKVAVTTNSGIFFKVLVDGDSISRKRGRWTIPMRNGKSGQLVVRGMLPGFQRLVFDDAEVHAFGADVPRVLRYLTLLPLLLVFINAFVGMVLAIILVFLNVLGVTNANVPLRFRWALPIMNTIAGAAMTFAILILSSGSGS